MSKKRFLKVKILLVMLCAFNLAHAQLKTITGTVKDEKGSPLANSTITAKGAKTVKTAADGTFSIAVPTAATSLIVSNTEFKDTTVDITTATTVEVKLFRKVTELSDVIVNVGYGTQKAKDVTGAITQVKGEAVKNLATQDVATLLQGRVAGVDVVAPSGQPGGTAQITIRGVASLNNAQPLYIIDGVKQDGIVTVNPQDIESMSVLKDASAAAIYGASAAGGVIIITTKRGKGAKPTVNFSTRYSVATPETIDLMNKSQFIQYKQDIKDPFFSNVGNAGLLDSATSVDWNKELYRNSIDQNYNLSVSGASPNVNYFMSGLYDKQEGSFLDNLSSLASARINTDVKVTNAIKIGEQMTAWTRSTTPVKTPVVSTPFFTQPLLNGGPVYSTSVPWGVYFNNYKGSNPVAQIKTADFDFPSNNFQGQVYMEAKLPIKYLTFKSTFGYTSQTYENDLFQNQYTTNGTVTVDTTGQVQNHLYRNKGTYQQTLVAYILSYDHTWGKHTVNLLGGYEQYANKTENLSTDVKDVNGTSFAYFPSSESLIPGNTSVSGGYDPYGLIKSVFGRANWDFDKKYFVTATVRRDENFTVFGPGNQSGIFPAISAGWNINEERFFKKYRGVINQLKLRASYGELGNSSISPYSFDVAYSPQIIQNFTPGGAAQASYTQTAIANKDIQWESTHEANIGIDGQALDGKIYFTIDWYNKNTTQLLYNVPVSLSSGVPASGQGFSGGAVTAGTYLENIGSVRNTGLDIAVGYNGKAGQVAYSIGATGSFNTNKVLSIETTDGIPDGFNNLPYGNSIWGGKSLTRTYDGLPFGQFWGYKSLGIISNAAQLAQAQLGQPGARLGDLMYATKMINGAPQPYDTIIGNPYPKFTFGINITANWKHFDIAMLFNGVMGVDLYNGVTPYEFESLDGSNVTSKVFQTSEYTHNGVTNGITKYPSIGYTDNFGNFSSDAANNGNYTNPSSYFVENGSYLKLKNLQIGYSFSNKLLSKVSIKMARVYVMANNVFTITKYSGVDPELGSQYAILSLDANGNVVGNGNGSSNYANTNNVGVVGNATTSRGIDGPGKYPNVKLYAVGLDLTF